MDNCISNIELNGILQETNLDIILNEYHYFNNNIALNEDFGDIIKNIKDKIVQFFKWLMDKITNFFKNIYNFIRNLFHKDEPLVKLSSENIKKLEQFINNNINESVDIIYENYSEDEKKFIKVIRACKKLDNEYNIVYQSDLIWFPELLKHITDTFCEIANNGNKLMPKIYKAIGEGKDKVDYIPFEDIKKYPIIHLADGVKFYNTRLNSMIVSGESAEPAIYSEFTTKEFELSNAVNIKSNNISKYAKDIMNFYYKEDDIVKMLKDMNSIYEKSLKGYENEMTKAYNNTKDVNISLSEMFTKATSFVNLFVNTLNKFTNDFIKCSAYGRTLAKKIVGNFTHWTITEIKRIKKSEK